MNKTILIIGLSGQFLFSMRFIIQWLYSEKYKKSMIPVQFWYFSLAGGILLLVYSILKKDMVFIFGQLPGVLVYSRNLYLIHSK